MKHRVIITQELILDTVVEAPADASIETLTELALQEADTGDDSFECEWSETKVGPPEGEDDADGRFRYLRDTTGRRSA
jgi:hypothetical protein